MRINAEFEADLVKLGLAFDDETEDRTCTPVVELMLDREKCRLIFGDEVERLAFGLAEPNGYLPIKGLELSIASEAHWVTICEFRVRVVPVLKKIKRSKDSSYQVIIPLELPHELNLPLIPELAGRFGGTVEISMIPINETIPQINRAADQDG